MQRAINRVQKRGFSTSFGVTIKERTFEAQNNRYGYQGSEVVEEIDSERNHITTYYREADLDIAQWWSIDPVFQPWQSPYTSMDNNPIWFNDPMGDKIKVQSVNETKDSEKGQKQFDKFNKSLDKIFKGKVSFTSTSDDISTTISGLSLNEGATLTKQEQAKFDYLNGLASSDDDFNVGLTDGVGTLRGEILSFNQSIGGETFNTIFNTELLDKVQDKPKDQIKTENIVLFGLTGGNINTFNDVSGVGLKDFQFKERHIGMLNNSARTVFTLQNSKRVIYSVNLTVRTLTMGALDNNSSLGKSFSSGIRSAEGDEVKVKTKLR